jgi:oligopeptide transport system ATP-binding protein
VTIQAQILDLILKLSQDMDMGVILVTHDLGVVAQTCDRVAVMYAGRIMEQGAVRQVLKGPRHPYTVGLMQSVPEGVAPRTQLYSVPGTPPSLAALPQGCAFAPRCAFVSAACAAKRPELESVGEGRELACFHPVEALDGVASKAGAHPARSPHMTEESAA